MMSVKRRKNLLKVNKEVSRVPVLSAVLLIHTTPKHLTREN